MIDIMIDIFKCHNDKIKTKLKINIYKEYNNGSNY